MEKILNRAKKQYIVYIDDEDVSRLYGFGMGIKLGNTGKVQAVTMVKRGKTCYLHRFLLNITDPNILVDHWNRNPLDNRKANLRLSDVNGNARNRTSFGIHSKYLGVSRCSPNEKYVASIGFDGQPHSLGLFDNEIDAAKQYDSAANYYFKEFANLNFPDEVKPFKPINEIVNESVQHFIDIGNPFRLNHILQYVNLYYSEFRVGHFIKHYIKTRLDELVDIGQLNENKKRTNPKNNSTWYYTNITIDNMNYKMIPLDQYMNLVKLDRIPHKRNSLVLLEDGTELMVYGVTLDAGGYIFDCVRGGSIKQTITHVLVNEADLPKQTISKDLLLLNGYKCWNENPEGGDWQKCIKDAAGGKKYFINIKERLGFNGEVNIRNWWPSIQFDVEIDVNITENIEVNLIQWFNNSGEWSGVTIEQMEEFCESVWTRLDGQYYEK